MTLPQLSIGIPIKYAVFPEFVPGPKCVKNVVNSPESISSCNNIKNKKIKNTIVIIITVHDENIFFLNYTLTLLNIFFIIK